jgi:hypothetical protein
MSHLADTMELSTANESTPLSSTGGLGAECEPASIKDVSTLEAGTEEEVPQEAISEADQQRLDFANRKVMIQNIYKFLDHRRVSKDVNQWVSDYHQVKSLTDPAVVVDKVKKPPKDNWAILTLKEEAMVQPFIDFFNEKKIKNRKGGDLFAKRPDSNYLAPDMRTSHEGNNRAQKRELGDDGNLADSADSGAADNGGSSGKRQRLDQQVMEARRFVSDDEVRNAVTPLWQLTPEEQLQHKTRDMIKNCAIKAFKEIKQRFR